MARPLRSATKGADASGHKYLAKKVEVDGISFPSKAEARRYGELKALAQAGEITELALHPAWEIAPRVVLDGKTCRARKYIADFAYVTRSGERVVEDVKGMRTDVYTLKRHLMKALHGIEVREVRYR